MLRNIKNFFEYEKEEVNYYKPVIVNNFWNNNCIEYKSNSDKNKILSVEKYLDKIGPYLREIINDLKQSDTWKIQLIVRINFISSTNDNDEDRAMHSKSDDIAIMRRDEADEAFKKNFLIHSKIDIKII